MSTTTNPPLLVVGRVFTADPNAPWAEAVLTDGDRIAYVGSQEQARRLAPSDVEVVVADGVVLPGFVDGHAHLQMSGAALLQAQLRSCASLAEIGDALAEWRTRHPARSAFWDSDGGSQPFPTAHPLDRCSTRS